MDGRLGSSGFAAGSARRTFRSRPTRERVELLSFCAAAIGAAWHRDAVGSSRIYIGRRNCGHALGAGFFLLAFYIAETRGGKKALTFVVVSVVVFVLIYGAFVTRRG